MKRRAPLPALSDANQFRAAVQREVEKSQTPDIAVDYFHVRAEDGKIYKVTVNSSGAFVLTLVLG